MTFSAQGSVIASSEIGKKLYTVTMQGEDIYTDTTHTTKAAVYSVKSLSQTCVVAVQYEGENELYSFVNSSYTPATLGNLIDDLNLRENLVFHDIYYDYFDDKTYTAMRYSLPDPAVIWDLLLSDSSLKNEGDAHYSNDLMSISIDVKIVGHENISLAVNEDGYLQTNILNTGKSFFIGKDKVNAFVEYVKKNGKGEILHQNDAGEGSSSSHNNTSSETVVSQGYNPGKNNSPVKDTPPQSGNVQSQPPATENITFTATVKTVYDGTLLVITSDNVGFDKAHVDYAKDYQPSFTPKVGQKLRITILPLIRETSPVQVTAVHMEPA